MDKGSTWRCCSESSHSSSLVILLVHSFYAWDQDPTSYQGWSKKGWRFGGMSLWWRWGSSLCPLWMRSRCACAVSSVTQSCLNLCSPMDCSMPGFPVHHQLPQLIQTHVHWVSDDIQPSYPLSSPSIPASNVSQHQSLFQWVNSSHQLAKVLELQHQSFQWIFIDWFWSPCSPRDSQESSPTPQFKSINSLALSFLYNPTLTSILLGKTIP